MNTGATAFAPGHQAVGDQIHQRPNYHFSGSSSDLLRQLKTPSMASSGHAMSLKSPLLVPTADRPRLLILIYTFMPSVSLSSGRGFCGTVTLVPALRVTGPHQNPPPHLLVPGPPRTAAAAVPDQERGAYAPSRTSSLHCRSCIRSGAAGTLPVPSPSWWTVSVLSLMFSHP